MTTTITLCNHVVTVDTDDLPRIQRHEWYICPFDRRKNRLTFRAKLDNKYRISLHRFIMRARRGDGAAVERVNTADRLNYSKQSFRVVRA